jgi:ketosteroid isomerase-like protein
MDQSVKLLLDRTTINETLHRYCASLDARDFEALASCFTDDCVATFSISPTEVDTVVGGKAVAKWCNGILKFAHSIHAVSHAIIKVDGDKATSTSLLVATLMYGTDRGGRAFVRGIKYVDALRRVGDVWLIEARTHQVLWQFDAVSQVPGLPSN